MTTRVGNPIYLLSAMLLHNLTRELQMIAHPPRRATTVKRTAPWALEKLQTMRQNLIQRADRLIRPQGKLVLSMNDNAAVERELLHYLDALKMAARGGRIYVTLGFTLFRICVYGCPRQVRPADLLQEPNHQPPAISITYRFPERLCLLKSVQDEAP